MLPNLPQLWTCWLVELPGFGTSDPVPAGSPEEFTINHIGAIIQNEVGKLGIRRPWYVGHSLGGYVALAIAEAFTEEVAGVVLFHSSPFADTPERRQARDKVIASVGLNGPAAFLAAFADGLFREKAEAWRYFREHTEAVSGEAIITYARMMRDRPDRTAFCRHTDVPLCVLAGRYDALITPDTARRISELQPSIQIAELSRSAHVGMLEEPLAAADILKFFINSAPAV